MDAPVTACTMNELVVLSPVPSIRHYCNPGTDPASLQPALLAACSLAKAVCRGSYLALITKA